MQRTTIYMPSVLLGPYLCCPDHCVLCNDDVERLWRSEGSAPNITNPCKMSQQNDLMPKSTVCIKMRLTDQGKDKLSAL